MVLTLRLYVLYGYENKQ